VNQAGKYSLGSSRITIFEQILSLNTGQKFYQTNFIALKACQPAGWREEINVFFTKKSFATLCLRGK